MKVISNLPWMVGLLFLFLSCSNPGLKLSEAEISLKDQATLSNYLQKFSALNQAQENDARDLDLPNDQRSSNLDTRVSNVQILTLETMNAFMRKEMISNVTQTDGWIQVHLVKIIEENYRGDCFLVVNATKHGINDWFGSAYYLRKKEDAFYLTGECSSPYHVSVYRGTIEDGKLIYHTGLIRPYGSGPIVGLIWDGKKLFFGPPPDPDKHPLISISKKGPTNLNVFGTTIPIYKHRPLGNGVWADFNGEYKIRIKNKKFYITNECQVDEDYLTAVLPKNTTFRIQGSRAEISAGWITITAQGILKSAVLARGRSFKTEAGTKVFVPALQVVSFTPEEWLRVPVTR